MDEPQAKILVVDDELKNVKLLEALLLPRGYAVVKAYNGEEALQQVQQEQPDLILLDVMMPLLDGFEVCKRLKENDETRLIPVVIMTALGQVEDRVKGIEAGADDFLTKPVNRDELMARIRTSLRLRQTIERKVGLLQGIQEHLAKFVPQAVQRLIAENPAAPELAKREQDVSILFADISGYTRLSEALPQEQVSFIVERYFSSFLDCVHARELHIHQNQRGVLLAGECNPSFASFRLQGRVAVKLQDITDQFQIFHIIFDDQDTFPRHEFVSPTVRCETSLTVPILLKCLTLSTVLPYGTA